MNENQSYGKFVVLSETAKEQMGKMSEAELSFISARIAHAIRDTEYELRQEYELSKSSKSE